MTNITKHAVNAHQATKTAGQVRDTAATPKPSRPRGMARGPDGNDTTPFTASQAPGRASKISQVVVLLRRNEGATLAEMTEATGWLPHTIRAALTGLKKEGHTIEKDKRDGATCYRIVEAC